MLNLMLHCGSQHVNREDAVLHAMPESIGARHCPIPYIELIDGVERALASYGLNIIQWFFLNCPFMEKQLGLILYSFLSYQGKLLR